MMEQGHGAGVRRGSGGSGARALTALVIAVAAWHLVYARMAVAVPYVFGDEAGYLTKAAALAGVYTNAYSPCYPGYALLIAPLFALSHNPHTVFAGVQVLDAVLAGLGAVAMWGLSGRISPRGTPGRRLLSVGVASLYAPFVAYSCFALSENVLIPLTLALGILLYEQVASPRLRNAGLIALLGSVLMLAHPRGAMVMVALYLAWWLAARSRRQVPYLVGTMLVNGLIFGLARRLLEHFFRLRMGYFSEGLTGQYPGVVRIWSGFRSLLSLHEWVAFAGNLAGQGLYLLSATAGLVGIGAIVLVRDSVRERHADHVREEERAARLAYALFAGSSLLLLMLMTAFFMRDGPRVDHQFYGRYDEIAVPLLMLPALLKPGTRRSWFGVMLVAAALGLLEVWVHGARMQGWVVRMDIFGWALWLGFGTRVLAEHDLDLFFVTAGTLVLLAALGMLARSRLQAAGIAAVFLAGSLIGLMRYLRPESDLCASQQRIPAFIKRHDPGTACVNYDSSASEFWERYNYEYVLLPVRIRNVALSAAPGPGTSRARTTRLCGSLIISTRADLDRRIPGARLLVKEYASNERLWLLPTRARYKEAKRSGNERGRRSLRAHERTCSRRHLLARGQPPASCSAMTD